MTKFLVLSLCLALFLQLSFQQGTNATCKFPEAATYTFPTYCGYLNVTMLRRLYYVFIEANTTASPQSLPLAIWLNGGPGCSSLIGLLQENGPFINQPGAAGINTNMYSWNNLANILYIESPAGVGFSENNDTSYVYNDNNTAADLYVALQNFYLMFPQFNTSLWITGESYAGQYIPFFATEILAMNQNKSNPKINLTGIMVGNGVMNFTDDSLNYATTDFYSTHQIFGYDLDNLWENDCQTNPNGPRCQYFYTAANELVELVDPYNIYNYNDPGAEVNISMKYANFHPMFRKQQLQQQSFKSETSRLLHAKKEPKKKNDVLDYMTEYYNKYKTNLNVQSSVEWEECADIDYNGFLPGSVLLYPNLISSGIKILLFNGDNDSVCPINGNLESIQTIQAMTGMQISSSWRQWYRSDNETAGFTQNYTGLTFCSVRGAGHMVPQYQPFTAFEMFGRFMNGQKF